MKDTIFSDTCMENAYKMPNQNDPRDETREAIVSNWSRMMNQSATSPYDNSATESVK
jgi:hypothetical protein